MSQLTLIDIPVENESYRLAMADYERYAKMQKEPVFLVYSKITNSFMAWNNCTIGGIKSCKSIKIVKCTHNLN